MSKVTRDNRNFIYVGGVKAGRVVNGRFEVCGKANNRVVDNGRKRSQQKLYVETTITELAVAMSTSACNS